MSIDLDALQALAEQATQDEWTRTPSCDDHYKHGIRCKAGIICLMPGWDVCRPAEQEANADFIAAAHPQTILSLIARIRELEEVRRDVKRLNYLERETTGFVVNCDRKDRPKFRLHLFSKWHTSLREAIDAAISGRTAEGGKEGL